MRAEMRTTDCGFPVRRRRGCCHVIGLYSQPAAPAIPTRSLLLSTTDAIIVLGRGVGADGSLPLIARARVERAVALHRQGVAPWLVFTGLCGLLMETRPAVSEAAAMAEHAASLGVPRSAMLLEEEARDTLGNAYFVWKRFMLPRDWWSIRVVTSDFHIPRAAWVFNKVLGPAYDVAFSAASSERFASTLVHRARAERDSAAFLAEWLGTMRDGDVAAIERLIAEEHPAYAATPRVTLQYVRDRMDELARIHRAGEAGVARGHRSVQERTPEL